MPLPPMFRHMQTDTRPRRKLRAIYPLLLASLDWRIVWNPQGLFFSWNFLGAGSFQKAVPFHYHTHWHMMGGGAAGGLSWINFTYFIFLKNCIFYFDLSSSYVFLTPKAFYGHFFFYPMPIFLGTCSSHTQNPEQVKEWSMWAWNCKTPEENWGASHHWSWKTCFGLSPQRTRAELDGWGSILHCSLGISANAAFNLLPQCVNLLKLFM